MTDLKILVFSDSHRSRGGMMNAIDREQPDLVIHLGDLAADAEELGYAYPRQSMICVPGNCDGWTTDPAIRLVTLEGHKVLLSHGHLWDVKRGYGGAIAAARKADAEILLFGHTHVAYCEQADGLWILNPGAARSSYGLILLENGAISCSILPTR